MIETPKKLTTVSQRTSGRQSLLPELEVVSPARVNLLEQGRLECPAERSPQLLAQKSSLSSELTCKSSSSPFPPQRISEKHTSLRTGKEKREKKEEEEENEDIVEKREKEEENEEHVEKEEEEEEEEVHVEEEEEERVKRKEDALNGKEVPFGSSESAAVEQSVPQPTRTRSGQPETRGKLKEPFVAPRKLRVR